MTRNLRRARPVALALVVTVVLAAAAVATESVDRLDRFRELAAARLGVAEVGGDDPASTYRDLYALLDDEIVESLASGSVFASPGFLQDRLDAFADVWGGARFRVRRLGSLLVGAFQLTDGARGNSIRVYGPVDGAPGLLATLVRDGRPTVHPLSAVDGAARFLAVWDGAPSGRGTHALRVDLVRQTADRVRVTWSTADAFPDGLEARAWSVRGDELRIRYELRYAGWTPGCDGQTEAEDVYRVGANDAVVRTGRTLHAAWHREMHAAVARLFAALARGDAGALTALVPDARLRARLPALAPEPACDALVGPGHDAVSVAAVGPDLRPWSLVFEKRGPRWRLTAAAPVLQ